MITLTPSTNLLTLLHAGCIVTLEDSHLRLYQWLDKFVVARFVDLQGWTPERTYPATRTGLVEACEYVSLPV